MRCREEGRQFPALWKPMDVPTGPSRRRLGRFSPIKPHLIGLIVTNTTRLVLTQSASPLGTQECSRGTRQPGYGSKTNGLPCPLVSRPSTLSLSLSCLSYPQLSVSSPLDAGTTKAIRSHALAYQSTVARRRHRSPPHRRRCTAT